MTLAMIDRLMKPDGVNLTALIWGQAGSGKSTGVQYWATNALKSARYDENWRAIYVSPKHENPFQDLKIGDKDIPILTDVEKAVKAIEKSRLVIWYPDSISTMDEALDYLITSLYEYKESNPDFSATLILDDAQTWIEPRRVNSPEMKRLILTGRSKRIKTVLVAHSIIINRMLEGQCDLVIAFDSGPPIYQKDALTRFNLDIEKYAISLREKQYSFLWHDVKENEPQLMNPLEIPE